MFKKFLYLFLFSGIAFFSCAQQPITAATPNEEETFSDSVFSYRSFIPGAFTKLDVDVLDNVFALSSGGQLKKYNFRGDSVAIFNDVKKYGNPSYLDVSNPLKILLYYKNYSTVVALDRNLVLRNTINFRNNNIFSVKAIGTSYDNNIWVFDEQDLKLKKIKDDGSLLQETNDWRLILEEVPSPERIIDQNNFVYSYDPAKGFFIFDYYGAFKNNLPFIGWDHIAVSGETLYGFKDRVLHAYKLASLDLREYNLPSMLGTFTDIKAMNGKLYVLRKKGVFIYQIKGEGVK